MTLIASSEICDWTSSEEEAATLFDVWMAAGKLVKSAGDAAFVANETG